MPRPASLFIAASVIIIAASACTLGASNSQSAEPTESLQQETGDLLASRPQVEIISPDEGAEVSVNEEVLVSVNATDVIGVTRVQLFANNQIVKTVSSPAVSGSKNFPTVLNYMPRVSGTVTLRVEAFRGTVASDPVEMNITVRNPAQPTPIPNPNSNLSIDAARPQIPNDGLCRALTTVGLRLRSEPTTEQDNIITVLPENTLVPVVGRLGDNSWWKVNHNGAVGWVSAQFTTLSGSCVNVPIEQDQTVVANPTNAPTNEPIVIVIPTATGAPGLPDLMVTNLVGNQFPAISRGNSSVTQIYSVTVTNRGNGPSGSFRVQSSVGDDVIDMGSVSNLNPGESINLSVNWRFDRPGTYTMRVVSDGNNQVNESNKANNSAALEIRVSEETRGAPDLMALNLTGDQAPVIPRGASSATRVYTFTIRNNGDERSGPFVVTATLGGRTIEVSQISNLNPGESFNLSMNWSFDQEGVFDLLIRADSNNQVSEGDESNNTASLTVDVKKEAPPPPPVSADLAMASLAGQEAITLEDGSGEVTSEYIITVANLGEADSGPFIVTSTMDGNLIEVGQGQNLPPGATQSFNVRWALTQPTTYQISAEVSALNAGNDSNMANNTDSLLVDVVMGVSALQIPDLFISNFAGEQRAELDPQTGSVTVIYQLTVTNQGGPAGNFAVMVSDGINEITVAQLEQLDGNESAQLSFDWTFVQAGSFELVTIVDPFNETQEADESNNRATLRLEVFEGDRDVVEGPGDSPIQLRQDISVSFQAGNHLPAIPDGEQEVDETYTFVIFNSGEAVTGPFSIISTNGLGEQKEVEHITELQPGESRDVQAEWRLQAGKTYEIRVIADAANQLGEEDKRNNSARILVNPVASSPGKPDLVIVEIQGPEEVAISGLPFVYTVVVQNIGDQPSGDFEISASLSSETIPVGQIQNLDPGQSAEIRAQWDHIEQTGDTQALFFVDSVQEVDENSEENNQASLEVRVTGE